MTHSSKTIFFFLTIFLVDQTVIQIKLSDDKELTIKVTKSSNRRLMGFTTMAASYR